jgi:hypothetical protein
VTGPGHGLVGRSGRSSTDPTVRRLNDHGTYSGGLSAARRGSGGLLDVDQARWLGVGGLVVRAEAAVVNGVNSVSLLSSKRVKAGWSVERGSFRSAVMRLTGVG